MPEHSIDAYLNALQEGAARQYLFLVTFAFPSDLTKTKDINNNINYYVRSTSLPESTYEDIAIPYPGYPFKMAGNRSYNDWTVSLNIDKNNDILKLFHEWHNLIYNPQTHQYTAPIVYMVSQSLQLLGPDLMPASTYILYRAWPKAIGAVTMDYSSTELATVDITFSYQYYMNKENIS